ncbi:uncharacterized protein B0I36DRAFT_90892 [Microdochium trichocladiopsis]|uniref:Uncharacterized protein n=1 Tax=Microdochium trichocladiopsis TaxID=1682393 RepID=A0A9P9BTB2_9PEZI|nr:uncharacterized protein B0I36DRAFT_90892 [Microdochium trichocladiopsis]KAH7035312.1 hypothetical protein B0I36DRAFT_90892 [Microdochium trichocladiopsis]
MDTLRQLARLPSDKFADDTPDIKTLQCISVRNYNNATRERGWSVTDQLPWNAISSLSALETEPDVSAALSLVKIPRDDNEVIGVPESTFQETFNACRLDPRFLHLIRSNRYGLHYESWQRRHCYYIGTVLYSLMWAFNPRTRITRAILLLRDSGSSRSFADFQRILNMESNRLHTPFVLSWVSLVQLSNWVDLVTYSQLRAVRTLENTTGHGPYGGNPVTTKLRQQQENMEELTKASRKVGSVLVDLANQSRHVAIGLSIASHLMSAIKLDKLESYTMDHTKDMFLEQLEAFTSGIPSIKRSLTDSKEYILYIQERSRNQATVITSLLTHEDARISIKLAQASKELAEAAKKDSSAMKTIAIMTMLFLPGTFFAALWAVPSLKWDQPGVIQDNFWIYWVFTVPSTIIIFTIWFGLHRWRHSPMPAISTLSPSSSSFVSSVWPRKKKSSKKSKLNATWTTGSDYLPLAIGGTNPASISLQHLNDDLPVPTSVPMHENMRYAPQTSVPFEYVADSHREQTSVPFMDRQNEREPTSATYTSPYHNDLAANQPPWVQDNSSRAAEAQYYAAPWTTPGSGEYVPQVSAVSAPPVAATAPPAHYTGSSDTYAVRVPPYAETAQPSAAGNQRMGIDTQDWAQPSPLSPIAGAHSQGQPNIAPYPPTTPRSR